MKTTLLLTGILISCVLNSQNIEKQSSSNFSKEIDFASQVIEPTAQGNIGIIAVDVDNDDDMDILTVEYNTHQLLLYRNEINPEQKTIPLTKIVIDDNIDGQYLDAKDMNNDNLPEILCSCPIDGEIVLYTSALEGDSVTWGKEVIISGFNGAHQVHLVDMDNDNDLDVLAAGNTSNSIKWWENNNNSWLCHVIESNYGEPQSVVYFDFNNDNYMDIVSGEMKQNSGLVNIWFSNYTDSLTFIKDTLDLGFYGSHWFEIADLNGDGLEDIIAAGYFSQKIGAWLRVDENTNEFTRVTPVENIGYPLHVTVSDIDNDGDMDILAPEIPGANHKIHCFENDNFTFIKHTLATYYKAPWQLTPVDIDNDTDIDIISGACFFNNPAGSGKLSLLTNLLVNEGIDNNSYSDCNTSISIYPNPVTDQTKIKLNLDEPSYASLEIYNCCGKLVKSLLNNQFCYNNQEILWHCIDSNGKPLADGIYICKFLRGNKIITQKIIKQNIHGD